MAHEFFKAHYLRPDGDTRDWSVYEHAQMEEESHLARILREMKATGTMIFMYHSSTMELTIVIPFMECEFDGFLDDLKDHVWNEGCLPNAEIMGCDAPYKLIFNEQF